MGWSHDVTLPVDASPRWPPVCVRCMERHPDSVFRFRAGRIGLDQILTLSWAVGSRPLLETPACRNCIPHLRRERWTAGIFSWLICIAAAAIGVGIVYLLGLLQSPFRRWFAVFGGIGGMMPVLIWEALHPPTLDATARHGRVDYEFKSPLYATMFAEANDAAVN